MDNNYRIIGQQKITGYNPMTRKFELGWNVEYVDQNTNTQSQVFVPIAQYPSQVDAMIQQEREHVGFVAGLGTPEG